MLQVLSNFWVWFSACFGIYFVYSCLPYSAAIKQSPWYFPLGIIFATAGNLTWMFLTKRLHTPTEILYAGLIFDIVIVFAMMAAGGSFDAYHLSWKTLAGTIFLVFGIVLLKL